MTAQLTFNLPEESAEHQIAIDGWKWRTVVADLNSYLRDALKYGNDFKSANHAIESTRERLFALMGEEGVSLDG